MSGTKTVFFKFNVRPDTIAKSRKHGTKYEAETEMLSLTRAKSSA